MIRPFIVLAALLAPTAALADEKWQKIDGPWAMEVASVKKDGDQVTARFRLEFEKPQVIPFINKQYDRSDRTYQFDCKEKKALLKTNVLYMGVEQISSYDASKTVNPFGGAAPRPSPTPVTGGSPEEKALQAACGAGGN